jgi:hypothetical protein
MDWKLGVHRNIDNFLLSASEEEIHLIRWIKRGPSKMDGNIGPEMHRLCSLQL